MSFTIKQDDAGNLIFQQSSQASGTSEGIFRFATGKEVAFGVGTTDTDIVYIRQNNGDGENAYVFPNAAQDAITVQAAKP